MNALNAALAAVPGDDLISAKVRGLTRGYHARWSSIQAHYNVLGVEELILAPLHNPDTGRTSRTFVTGGKLDVRAERLGRHVVIDHKTTSDDITDPNAPYWRQLIVASQPSHYMLLEWQNGRKIDEAVWDVVRKPGISPRKLSAAEVKAAVTDRHYCGASLQGLQVASLAANGRETLFMYEHRLAQDCITVRPEWYFARRTVVRIDGDMIDYARELWNDGQEVLLARNMERHGKNSGACMHHRTPCKFLGICSGHDSADSAKWVRKPFVHNELVGIEGDGRDLLTNSRLEMFRTCRRKHYYSYELGIDRADRDEEETEALWFGTLWHRAQEAWWSAYIGAGVETQELVCG